MGRFKNYFGLGAAAFIGVASLFLVFGGNNRISYIAPGNEIAAPSQEKIQHLRTPEPTRAIYMTSWVAGTADWRENLVKFVEETELNAVVIDIKDYSGRVSFETDDAHIKDLGSSEKRIIDIKEFIEYLHQKNIYVIGRISVFQDPYFVSKRPDLAVKKKDGSVWKDRKGLTWIDPAAKEFWAYTVLVAKASEKAGFDELNFDYVRFPSDGNMKDIKYDYWDEVTPPAEVIGDFFAYLRRELDGVGLPLSVDLFGMVTVNYDDLNIGQVLENAALYFDYIAPMVYPSHYPPGFNNFKNPALHPYEIVHQAMTVASGRLTAASSSPSKLRPWLQDFDLGATYDAGMVRAQMQAVYDAGLTGWMVWDAGNKYTRDAYMKE
ncbi:MAG: putative glycoside hydrolase [Candidatus Niyogibacteria bacterium]|nr:MAG: putative glycoside hydrolase [Candidatus Niyogibacteria bacterium]